MPPSKHDIGDAAFNLSQEIANARVNTHSPKLILDELLSTKTYVSEGLVITEQQLNASVDTINSYQVGTLYRYDEELPGCIRSFFFSADSYVAAELKAQHMLKECGSTSVYKPTELTAYPKEGWTVLDIT